jgi:hypothetical protein
LRNLARELPQVSCSRCARSRQRHEGAHGTGHSADHLQKPPAHVVYRVHAPKVFGAAFGKAFVDRAKKRSGIDIAIDALYKSVDTFRAGLRDAAQTSIDDAQTWLPPEVGMS